MSGREQMPVKLASYPVRVTVRGGTPVCPCCGDAMVEREPNAWACPMYDAVFRKLSESLAEAMHASERDTPP